MNRNDARAAVIDQLQRRGVGGADGISIIEAETMEKPYGWIFFYNSRRFVESGELVYALVGHGPVIVVAETGEIIELESALPSEIAMRSWRSISGLLGGCDPSDRNKAMVKKRLEYSPPQPMTATEVVGILEQGEPEAVQQALVSIALLETNLDSAYALVMRCANSSHEGIRGTALLCLGHLARIHRGLPDSEAAALVTAGLKDESEYVRGQSHNAADDIRQFAPAVGKLIGK